MAKDNNGKSQPQKESGTMDNNEQGVPCQGAESGLHEEIFLIPQGDIRSSKQLPNRISERRRSVSASATRLLPEGNLYSGRLFYGTDNLTFRA